LIYYILIAGFGIFLQHFVADAVAGPRGHWTRLTLDALVTTGIGIALFVVTSKLARTRSEAVDRSNLATRQLVDRLALASEIRDSDASATSSRIGRYAAAIAQELGLSAEDQALLQEAASLHDIGKLSIRDSILQKPGPLTPEERLEMQRHVLFGAELLVGCRQPVMHVAYNIVLTHHEEWNGRGYPNGLSGPQIPLAGRIVAVCDTFEALISDRPYKEAWPINDAVIEILRLSGKRFDPIVVNAFHRSLPKIIEIQAEKLPKVVVRESACYLPLEPIIRLDASHWYPQPVRQAQLENQAALEKLLFADSEVRA
jgi:HD-GYP domain-containing protein (c-di-GMP phosphodiesterase class II)